MVRLELECIPCSEVRNRHGKGPVRYEADLPDWLCAAAVIAFHSNHEGHTMKVVADGEQIYPPAIED